MRKELCYVNYTNSECGNAMIQPQTRMVCCCSMGAGWGKNCEECPKQGTRNEKYIIRFVITAANYYQLE